MNRLDEMEPETRTALVMHRATVCLWADSIEEKVEFTAWQTAWKKRMTFVSRDYGCGCCIHLFDLEGPKEAIDALPRELLTVSAWTEYGEDLTTKYTNHTKAQASNRITARIWLSFRVFRVFRGPP